MFEIDHVKAYEMADEDLVPKKLDLPWRTTKNKNDCGVFAMRHMESYFGVSAISKWKMGFGKEGPAQEKLLEKVRKKYAATILLSELNTKREEVMDASLKYQLLDPEIRGKDEYNAQFNVEGRVNSCG